MATEQSIKETICSDLDLPWNPDCFYPANLHYMVAKCDSGRIVVFANPLQGIEADASEEAKREMVDFVARKITEHVLRLSSENQQ